MSKISNFEWNGKSLAVSLVETIPISDGVKCDVHAFLGDASKDLGIVRVKSGSKTPLQRVLKGTHTIEGFVSGSGVLTVANKDGVSTSYRYPNGGAPAEVEVQIGETMQWCTEGGLVFYEICEPPYDDGRYENLSQ